MRELMTEKGFTLIELVIIIMVLGVLATVATRRMQESISTSKYEHTKTELDQLARAIVGNQGAYSDGSRTDFGYIGDVGALPVNLDALISNPGGYSTWNGPYIEAGNVGTEFKTDAWGSVYTLTGTTIRSTGSGGNIDKLFSPSSALLFSNSVEGTVVDASGDLPGSVYKDSLSVRLSYPDGSGGTTTATAALTSYGYFSFSSLPIGNHTLTIIYIPDTDTVTYQVAIYPGHSSRLNILFPADLW